MNEFRGSAAPRFVIPAKVGIQYAAGLNKGGYFFIIKIYMKHIESYIKYGGAALLLLFSLFTLASGMPNVWFPMPFFLVFLAWTAGFFFLLTMPTVYLIVVYFTNRPKYFSIIIIFLATVLAVLNAYYFNISWDYGVRFQGDQHTKIVMIENIVGFGVVISLAIWAHFKKSLIGSLSANLLLFIILTWCAFPYLGELP
ncbi:MAG: hypothetical protein KAI89_09630 [Emcibacter sp.]|nr:hypothetical protein [Emcibacter sp.]